MRYRVGFCSAVSFFLFLILFSSTALSSTIQSDLIIINETKIPVHQSWKYDLDIYDDKIIWMDSQENYDIYMYDLTTSKEVQISDKSNCGTQYYSSFSVYNDKIVWEDDCDSDIYLYNLSTHEERKITDDIAVQQNPDIFENVVVWEDDRNGAYMVPKTDIYIYNLSTNQETQITTSGLATKPTIYGSRIVWSDNRSGNGGDIYMYDISTSKETQITFTGRSSYPDIYDDRIVWNDNRSGKLNIYMYNLSTHQETQITTYKSEPSDPAIYGDIIVWMDFRNVHNPDIYMYDLSTSKETQITAHVTAESPAIYGNSIVWFERHYGDNPTVDICMATLNSNFSFSSSSAPPTNVELNSNIQTDSVFRSISSGNDSLEKQKNFENPKISTDNIVALFGAFATIIGAIGAILAAYISIKKNK